MRHVNDEPLAGWPTVPPTAVSWTLPELDSIAEAMAEAVLREVPEYARSGDVCPRVVRRVARDVAQQFAVRIADPAAPWQATARLFCDIGWLEAAQGRSLDALHAACRTGARVAWERLRDKARRSPRDAEMFAAVGEAIFCFLDELAATCSASYAEAVAELASDTDRLSRRLLAMLVSDPPAPQPVIENLAREAGWQLPRLVSAVALASCVRDTQGTLPSLPPGVLLDVSRGDPCLVVPDPDEPERLRQVESSLRAWLADAAPADICLAAVGPAVPLTRASGSLRWARQTLALARRGVTTGSGRIIRCDDHLSTLVLLADSGLARLLSRQALAPLRRLRPDRADMLAATLLAWLDSADDTMATARLMHIHPQTVRYRLRQIAELYGDGLRDPDTRFNLQLALRARHVLDAAPDPAPSSV